MPDRFFMGTPELNVSGARSSARRTDESPFRILVTGDFSGRESRGILESVRGRKFRTVDLDKFDAVLAAMAPRLEVELPRGEKIALQFRRLEDFHPDRIWEQNEFFAPHREMRAQLKNPATFAAAVAALAPQSGAPAAAPPSAGEAADLWKQLTDLPASKPSSSPASTPAAAAASLIKQAVASHVVSGPDPRQADTMAAFDAAVSGQMRALLHHPHFQALEAAWRGVDFLLRHVDADETLEVCLLDVSRGEVAVDVRAADTVSGMVEIIVEQPWSLVAGLFAFQPDDDDADLLARLAKIASVARVPFLAGAAPSFLKAAEARPDERAELPAAWQTLRSLPEARHAGLIAPRFLLRLPYGKSTDETDHFAFEEMPAKAVAGGGAGALLWGNPALVAAVLLATTWRDEGWGFSAPVNGTISGLPVHVFTEGGEKRLTPCGEVLLTDRVAENLQGLGVMALASVRERDSVRLLRFQSIAQQVSGLAGL